MSGAGGRWGGNIVDSREDRYMGLGVHIHVHVRIIYSV